MLDTTHGQALHVGPGPQTSPVMLMQPMGPDRLSTTALYYHITGFAELNEIS